MSQIDNLPPLREVINAHGLRAKKELGQNFLLDLNLTARIARVGGSLEGVRVIEVGPGPGGLTRALLAEGAREVIAIERDARALPALAEVSDAYPGRLTVIGGDAMEMDYRLLADGPTRIAANLPYNIGTQLLTGWLTMEPWPPFFESLTLMFQREWLSGSWPGPATITMAGSAFWPAGALTPASPSMWASRPSCPRPASPRRWCTSCPGRLKRDCQSSWSNR